MDALEWHDSYVLLELKARHERVGKLAEYFTFAFQLIMVMLPKLHILIKIILQAHLELKASKQAPRILGMEHEEEILQSIVKDMTEADKALQ